MIRWYAVHTQPQAEGRARLNLERQDFRVYMPEFLKRRRHARRSEWVRAPLFPRYLFVAMDVGKARWRAINSTFGVSHLVSRGSEPLAVPEDIIQAIRNREGEDGLIAMNEIPVPFKKGDPVRITEGAFKDLVGLFDGIDEKHRIFVLLDLLGRPVKLRLTEAQMAASV